MEGELKMEFQDISKTAKTMKRELILLVLLCTVLGGAVAWLKPVEYMTRATFVLKGESILSEGDTARFFPLIETRVKAEGVSFQLNKDSSVIYLKALANSPSEAQEKAIQILDQTSSLIASINEEKIETSTEALRLLQQKIEEKEELLTVYEQENGKKGPRYDRLQRDVNDVRDVYRRRYDEYMRTICRVEVLEAPVLPNYPEKTHRTDVVLAGFLAGCFLAFSYSAWKTSKFNRKG